MDNIISSEFKSGESLFHYTSQAGLRGILSTGKLWATHYSFLNDKKEIIAAEQSLGLHLSKRLAADLAAHKIMGRHAKILGGINIKETAQEEAIRIVTVIYAAALKFVSPFITSFFVCDSDAEPIAYRDGLLRHWATYGRDGGYALQLSPEKVKMALNRDAEDFTHSGVFLTRVSYLDQDSASLSQELRESYDHLATVARDMVEYELKGFTEEEALHRSIEGSFRPFAHVICSTKLGYFADECEARIALFRPTTEAIKRAQTIAAHPILLRDGNIPIPYISLFCGQLLKAGCIERIILGPHPENDLRKKALDLFFESEELEIPITITEVPYVTRR